MMGGIVCMCLGIAFFIMVWVQARESVYFRDNSKQVTALVVETREVPFTVTGSSKEQYRYEMTVTFEVDGREQSADGYIEKWQYVEHAFTPGGEVTCYYDTNDPSKVIFYDPASFAAKGDRNYKIAFALLIFGAALFLIDKFLLK